MAGPRLLNYRDAGGVVASVAVDGRAYRLDRIPTPSGATTVLQLLEDWDASFPAVAEAAGRLDPAAGVDLDGLRLEAPVLHPNAIYCAAANYRDHMHAMAEKLKQPVEPDPHDLDIHPYHFVVPGRSCTLGPHDAIELPAHGRQVDWEIELTAVIGRRARRVGLEDALSHVAAYTVGIDVSVRDRRFIKIPNVGLESVFRNDFIGMKGFDRSCALGPWLTPAGEVADPQDLRMTLSIDGEVMQDSSTSQMVFTLAEQISYLSSRVTLLPGDLVMTGTPAGTGMERDRFLRPGERVHTRIEGLGGMSHAVAEAAA